MENIFTKQDPTALKTTIVEEISSFISSAQGQGFTSGLWQDPVVACASANDPLFGRLKEAVGPEHLLPHDLLPDARTVITYFIPFTPQVGMSNTDGFSASRLWAKAYVETNRLISRINDHLAALLGTMGYVCAGMAPTHNFDKKTLLSRWSHRHVSYIAGLGKFGLHKLLITEKGCCGRLGSIVTSAFLEETRREEKESCLFFHNGTCGTCISRCPTGALKHDGLDKTLCYEMLLENASLYRDEGLADVCGKCSCMIPCSFTNPVGKSTT